MKEWKKKIRTFAKSYLRDIKAMKTVKQSSKKVAANAYGRPEQNNGFVNCGHNMFGTNTAHRTRNLKVTSHHP